MEDVALLFGICAVVIIYTNRKLRGVFEESLQELKILLYGHCHKEIIQELVQRNTTVFEKIQAIVGQDRGTYVSILQNI